MLVISFSRGAAAQREPGSHHSWGF